MINDEIIIAGQSVSLRSLDRKDLKGIYVDALVKYAFFETQFQDFKFLVLKPKNSIHQSPLQLKKTADIISEKKGMPCVFLFDDIAYYERNRMIEQNVYFVVSDKYVFLPFLLIKTKATQRVKTDKLSMTSQYIILYHLQCKRIEYCTLAALEEMLPYKYVTLSRAIRQLDAMSLLNVEFDNDGTKVFSFEKDLQSFWLKVKPLLQTPIKSTYYCNNIVKSGYVSGINALSHYTSLNPDPYPSIAVDNDTFKELQFQNIFKGLNNHEGIMTIEVWKYPPLQSVSDSAYVDRISLYLSLRNSHDPRIEKTLEDMMADMGFEINI